VDSIGGGSNRPIGRGAAIVVWTAAEKKFQACDIRAAAAAV